jgi:hypothetical protein
MFVFKYVLPDEQFDVLGQEIVCAWCLKRIAKGINPKTYGICNKCFKSELEKKLNENTKNTKLVDSI